MRSFVIAVLVLLGYGSIAHAQNINLLTYDIGDPTLTQLWVDPLNGSDSRSGASRALALKTINAAWAKIPKSTPLTTGYEINLVAGVYPESSIPNYWESAWGSAQYPVILKSADGDREAVLKGDINAFDVRYFYVLGVSIIPEPAGDAFHCEQCDHVLLRNLEMDGGGSQTNLRGQGAGAHDLVKVNQCQHFYIEGCDIHGAGDNPLDFVAVQYGHVVRSRIHDGNDWCAYVKGGSAYFKIESNHFYDCGTGGFTAGQGAGLEFLVSPWIHYEAYDVKAINNVTYDVDGAGLGVNGGYNILFAHNTLYKVGVRSHVLEAVFGSRTCDGSPSECATRMALGAWGTATVGVEGEPIPNRNVYLYNNVVYNPAPYRSQHQHFAIQGQRTPSSGSNISSPAAADNNLRIKGNVIWNGSPGFPLGIEGESDGCQDSNTSCNAAQLVAENSINTVEPAFIDPSTNDFRPAAASSLLSVTPVTIPSFPGGDRESTPLASEGVLENTVTRDFGESSRSSPSTVGAYGGPSSSITPPGFSDAGGSTIDNAPTIRSASCTPRRQKRSKNVTCTVNASDDKRISSVVVSFSNRGRVRLSKSRSVYTGKYKLPKTARPGRLTATATVTDSAGQASTRSCGTITVTK